MRLSCRSFILLFLFLQAAQSIPDWIKRSNFWGRKSRPNFARGGYRALLSRGGTSDDKLDIITLNESETMLVVESSSSSGIKRPRHSSDLIFELTRRSSVSEDDNSLTIRHLITSRSQEYLKELQEAVHSDTDSSSDNKLPHPRKLLHYLAPKVPAIKQSPDVNLRIHSARSDIDSGVAACIIGSLAHAAEAYDKAKMQLAEEKPQSVATDLTSDRRFEQLVECVLSGVNMKKRKRESLKLKMDKKGEDAGDIEEILDAEDIEESDGLNTRDACRAAWGIAILGAHHLDSIGDEKVLDLLLALSLRTRELLLARLQLLRQDDLLSDTSLVHLTNEERLNELSEEIAEDAASAMWTFACVRACTGLRSVPLFETCCSILCQDPVDLRRRAQEVDEETGSSNIGNNDVIDRLARSADDDEEESSNSTTTIIPPASEKDALLDWLSRTEVNDILWALALHGSPNSTLSDDEVTLSDTAATLREIAFDRLIEWLEEDLEFAENMNHEESVGVPSRDGLSEQEEVMTVEVVDAATLLASQAEASASSSTTSVTNLKVENMTLRTGYAGGGNVQEVEVVDAATLLASTEGNSLVTVETEVMLAPRSSLSESIQQDEPNEYATDDFQSPGGSLSSSNTPECPAKERLFSPHDLASIAWSVTELRDPLRMHVLPIIVKLVAMLGEAGTESLSGADLGNLAWAVSRFEAEASKTEVHEPSSLSLSIISWVAHTALKRVTNDSKDLDESKINVLDEFQPPELGRLLWAVACTMSTYDKVPESVRSDKGIHKFAGLALKTAASNLSLFSTEDLLRICWAFLELCGAEGTSYDSSISLSLGRILSTIEQSLYRWERGGCASTSSGTAHLGGHQTIFSSFFGKPRIGLSFLEQAVGDHDDDDDDALAPIIQKSRRPRLSDLSVDPSTLCKAACAFQRLLVRHPEIKGGWKLTQVAIRLLSSKDAQLMKECSIHDIVRLCEAAVRSDTEGHGRELITGLFSHKVIKVLNEALAEDISRSSSIQVSAASPTEIATLVWALGDLGVKHTPPDESRKTAYKRLRLVTDKPLLTSEQVKSLEMFSAAKLLQGMVLMKFFSSDPSFLLHILQEVHRKMTNQLAVDELCQLAETLAILKEALKSGESSEEKPRDKQGKDRHSGNEESFTVDDVVVSDEEASIIPVDDASIEDELKYHTDKVLESIAQISHEKAKYMTTQEIRRLLSVYSLLPFKADKLIDIFEEEVSARVSVSSVASTASIEASLKDAKEKSEFVKRHLFEDHGSSRLDALKNSFMSLFRSGDETELEENSLPEDLATMIQESINSTLEAATALQAMQDTLRLSLDSIGRRTREGSSFELGRCQELIATYRRMEFSTGTRRSRYDKERRKDISKRVLSRLLPE